MFSPAAAAPDSRRAGSLARPALYGYPEVDDMVQTRLRHVPLTMLS